MRPIYGAKMFKRNIVEKGRNKDVEFVVIKQDLSFWDTTANAWIAEPCMFELLIGASSIDIR